MTVSKETSAEYRFINKVLYGRGPKWQLNIIYKSKVTAKTFVD